VPIRSLRITLPWYARLEEIRQVFSQGRLKEQQDLARFQQAWTQSRAEIEEKHRQNWDARWKSQERQSLAMREILGGTETYTNPYESRTVDLPGGYKAYWVSNQGKVLLSDDVGVDPRQGSTEEWRKMERYTP
jgi:hypothetical protein